MWCSSTSRKASSCAIEVAAARAGAQVRHLGAMGTGDDWVLDMLGAAGIDTGAVARLDGVATGHAIILVDDSGENSIILAGQAIRGVALGVGVTAIVQPGGSVRDEDSIRKADEKGIAMVFTGERHFKH